MQISVLVFSFAAFFSLTMIRSSTALSTALITGSTDGIGLHTARKLLESGHKVIVHGRNQQRVDAAVSDLSKYGEVSSYTADLSSVSGCLSLANAIKRDHSTLEILINNAGVFSPTFTTTPSGLETTFAVNVLAPFIITRELLPLLLATSSSRIINVSSISQNDGPSTIKVSTVLSSIFQDPSTYDKYSSYGISKRLIAMYSQTLSRRLSSMGVPHPTVMSCDPGTVNTKMLSAGWGNCGIDISLANNEFMLATKEIKGDDHGKYWYGGRVHGDCVREEEGEELWRLLEQLSTRE
ncbi:hypothetical protein TrVE_jg12966 [Triparma verrucosa]|nr:hypothetical protein TrVE_jg12966 [Triparma verrucosa]